MKSLSLRATGALLALALLAGCASHHLEAARREQEAADTLRGVGATQAAQAAQQRADTERAAAQCGDVFACALDLLGQVALGILGVPAK